VEGFFGLARDLTEQRRLEQQLRRAQKMEILGTLAGGLAHDFNNLLSGILGYASLLLSQGDLTPRQRRYLKVIDHSAGRAAQLTQQLLSLSKSRQIHPEPVRLGELMAEVLAILEHSFPANLVVQSRVEPDCVTRRIGPDRQHGPGRHGDRRPPAVVERVAVGHQHAERIVAADEVEHDQRAPARPLGAGQGRPESGRRHRHGDRSAAPHESPPRHRHATSPAFQEHVPPGRARA
jgi:signal transduction histidine kinase